METSLSQDSSTVYGLDDTFDCQNQAKDLTGLEDFHQAHVHEQLDAVGLGVPLKKLPREVRGMSVVGEIEEEAFLDLLFENTESRFGQI
jgi:hypothetical protein